MKKEVKIKKAILFNIFQLNWPEYRTEGSNFGNDSVKLCCLLSSLVCEINSINIYSLCEHLTVQEALNEICGIPMKMRREESTISGNAIFKSEEDIKKIKHEVIKLFYKHFEPSINFDDKNILKNTTIKSKKYLISFVVNGGWDMIENLRKGTVLDNYNHMLSLYNITGLLLDILNENDNKPISCYKGFQENIYFDDTISKQMRNLFRTYLIENLSNMDNLQNAMIKYPEYQELKLFAEISRDTLMKDILPPVIYSQSRENLIKYIYAYEDYLSGKLKSQILSGDDKKLKKQISILRDNIEKFIHENIRVIFRSSYKSDKKNKRYALSRKEEETMLYHYYYPRWYNLIKWKKDDSITDKCVFLYDLGIIFGFNHKTNIKDNEKLKKVKPYL